ncbi:class I SAM-dependent methyltransferase [bacterium]|nr:class I SAM-dependent methyltransferase [candidate division CSSED10-310 bacterium]
MIVFVDDRQIHHAFTLACTGMVSPSGFIHLEKRTLRQWIQGAVVYYHDAREEGMGDIKATGWDGYELLDSGDGGKLERFGAWVISRPAPQAIWRRRLPDEVWRQAHAHYTRESSGGGFWTMNGLPESWEVPWESFRFILKPTGFGHLGMFPEQQPLWRWVAQVIHANQHPLDLLNLFAYTGTMTLAAARAGARVCHLDAARGVVDWGKENAARVGCASLPIRWIVDDALKFIQREARRNNRYQAVILDPPSFGRGPKGQVWKLERDLPVLLDGILELLSAPRFVLISCHTPGVSPVALANLLDMVNTSHAGMIEYGDMLQTGAGTLPLSNGVYAVWRAPGTVPVASASG